MAHLLIADDNARDGQRYRAYLEYDNLAVTVCSNAAEAVQQLKDGNPSFDAAMVLWELSGQPCGSELVTLLRRISPSLPVLVVSGLLDLSLADRARALGACDFLHKPIERDRIRKAVHTAIRGGPPHPLVDFLCRRIVGTSPAFFAVLEQLAPIIAQPSPSP